MRSRGRAAWLAAGARTGGAAGRGRWARGHAARLAAAVRRAVSVGRTREEAAGEGGSIGSGGLARGGGDRASAREEGCSSGGGVDEMGLRRAGKRCGCG
jgi:hypothetical protein